MKIPNPLPKDSYVSVLFWVSILLLACSASTVDEMTKVDFPTATIEPLMTNVPMETNQPLETGLKPMVLIGEASFIVEVADTQDKRTQGLSGREYLDQGAGMIFLYEEVGRLTFWMKDMYFPLDMLWIGGDCRVADISAQVQPPEPDQSNRELHLISPNQPALHVLEINGGEAADAGISIGDSIKFAGSLEGRYGC